MAKVRVDAEHLGNLIHLEAPSFMDVSPFMDSLDPVVLDPVGIGLGGPVDESFELHLTRGCTA